MDQLLDQVRDAVEGQIVRQQTLLLAQANRHRILRDSALLS